MESHHQNIKSLILDYYNLFLFLESNFIHIIALYFINNALNSLLIIQLYALERHNNSISLNKMVYVYMHSY